jgi:hypothetical protein
MCFHRRPGLVEQAPQFRRWILTDTFPGLFQRKLDKLKAPVEALHRTEAYLNGTEMTAVGNFNFDLDTNYTTTISSDYSRLSIAAVAPDGSASLMLFLVNPPPPNPNAPFRGLYDAPVGYNFGKAGASLSVPSLNQDETEVVYSVLVKGGQHLWIMTSVSPISPYGS